PTWEDYIRPVSNILSAHVVTNRLPGQDGLDMLIVGDDKTSKLTRWAEVVEKKQGKPLNYFYERMYVCCWALLPLQHVPRMRKKP
ncbi:MAG: hypothetical protein SPF43_11240, partial [Bacteroidales bacterium]|nr:hypothetical protein [Bacteroidales bacterium]